LFIEAEENQSIYFIAKNSTVAFLKGLMNLTQYTHLEVSLKTEVGWGQDRRMTVRFESLSSERSEKPNMEYQIDTPYANSAGGLTDSEWRTFRVPLGVVSSYQYILRIYLQVQSEPLNFYVDNVRFMALDTRVKSVNFAVTAPKLVKLPFATAPVAP
jgi:hypothetical protein